MEVTAKILAVNQLVRFHFFGFTSSVALCGAASVEAAPAARRVLSLLGAALAFHVFTYLQNDVFDLEIDRTQELRRNDLLVSGRLGARTAMALALAQIPLAAGFLCWASAPALAYAVLAGAFALMTVYNACGKRCPIPPATDLIQGMSWGSLALVGALVAGGRLAPLTFLAATYGAGFLFLINGVHGGLRDLDNDLPRGMKTTAIYLGAHLGPRGEILSSRGVQAFGYFAFALLVAPYAIVVAGNLTGLDDATWWRVAVPWLALQATSTAILARVVRPIEPNRRWILSSHALPLLLPPILVFLPLMGAPLRATTLACFFGPFVAMDPALESVRGWWRRAVAATPWAAPAAPDSNRD